MKHKKLIIDLENEASGTITNPSQWQNTCSRMLLLNEGVKDRPHSLRAVGSSKEEQGDYCCQGELN
jgi:hypothetical protein